MDFRQYDNALGRFHNMDRLTELAPGITPYRFGFNNPNYWSDPTGLFENIFQALNHMFQNNIEGTILYHGGQGAYYSIETDTSSIMMIDGQLIIGVRIEAITVVKTGGAPSKSGGGSDFGNGMFSFATWGIGTNTSGWKGTTTHSINYDDFIGLGGAKARSIKLLRGFLSKLKAFFTGSKDAAEVVSKVSTIHTKITENPNATTMEVQNVSPVVPQAVEITVRVFALDTINLLGKYLVTSHKDITTSSQTQIDSLHNVNEKFNSNYNFWLNHVNNLNK